MVAGTGYGDELLDEPLKECHAVDRASAPTALREERRIRKRDNSDIHPIGQATIRKSLTLSARTRGSFSANGMAAASDVD